MTDKKEVMVFVFPREGPIRSLCRIDGQFSSVSDGLGLCEALGFVFESFDEIVCEEVRERKLQVDSGDSVLADPDAIKEGLVERPPNFVGGVEVRLLALGDEGESVFEVAFDVVEAQGAGVEDALRGFFFGGDPGLFFLEEIDGDGVGVMCLEQLLALCLQLLQPASLPLDLTAVQVLGDVDVIADVSSDLVDALSGEADDLVVPLDGAFHVEAR